MLDRLVGRPSSPTPIESWVNTQVAGSSMIAERRIGARM